MNMEKKLSNMFSSMSKEDLIDFLKDCNVEIESVAPRMGGMFGVMRYLTAEGQKDYNDNLNNLYKDSGIKLFDFL